MNSPIWIRWFTEINLRNFSFLETILNFWLDSRCLRINNNNDDDDNDDDDDYEVDNDVDDDDQMMVVMMTMMMVMMMMMMTTLLIYCAPQFTNKYTNKYAINSGQLHFWTFAMESTLTSIQVGWNILIYSWMSSLSAGRRSPHTWAGLCWNYQRDWSCFIQLITFLKSLLSCYLPYIWLSHSSFL